MYDRLCIPANLTSDRAFQGVICGTDMPPLIVFTRYSNLVGKPGKLQGQGDSNAETSQSSSHVSRQSGPPTAGGPTVLNGARRQARRR